MNADSPYNSVRHLDKHSLLQATTGGDLHNMPGVVGKAPSLKDGAIPQLLAHSEAACSTGCTSTARTLSESWLLSMCCRCVWCPLLDTPHRTTQPQPTPHHTTAILHTPALNHPCHVVRHLDRTYTAASTSTRCQELPSGGELHLFSQSYPTTPCTFQSCCSRGCMSRALQTIHNAKCQQATCTIQEAQHLLIYSTGLLHFFTYSKALLHTPPPTPPPDLQRLWS